MTDEDRDAQIRQRQYDVYTAAEAVRARRELRWVREIARNGGYSFNDVRRARQQYRRARGMAPAVWHWGPTPEERDAHQQRKAA